ncbi:hypothetical protein GCM10008983_11820 [Lentibacillus halophilus]|uniref:Uncharacterized protein n=1 Tax=Lentibacillus halophilus TaxID=295065 RepID=A0ABN0Z7I4_9BACI
MDDLNKHFDNVSKDSQVTIEFEDGETVELDYYDKEGLAPTFSTAGDTISGHSEEEINKAELVVINPKK